MTLLFFRVTFFMATVQYAEDQNEAWVLYFTMPPRIQVVSAALSKEPWTPSSEHQGNDSRYFFSPSSFSWLLFHMISCSLKGLNSFHRWEAALIMILHPRTRYDNSGSRNTGSLFHRFWSERTANGLVPKREIHMFHERQRLARSNTGREAT